MSFRVKLNNIFLCFVITFCLIIVYQTKLLTCVDQERLSSMVIPKNFVELEVLIIESSNCISNGDLSGQNFIIVVLFMLSKKLVRFKPVYQDLHVMG